jgi:hypothetical protein
VRLNEQVVCADGFSMSVQANESAYCTPRINNAEKYEEVEVGFAEPREELLLPYAEGEEWHGDVYPWVPSQIVVDVIAKHGGIVSGELPSGIPYLETVYETR